MKNLFFNALLFSIALSAIGCKNKTKPKQINNSKIATVAVTGDYGSLDYEKRNEGYDWVGVSVKQITDSTLHISVRSRADKKNRLAHLMPMR